MSAHLEAAVRAAAASLHSAISDAEAAGLSVSWPSKPAGLPAIAITGTASTAAIAIAPEIAAPAPAAEPEPEAVEDAPAEDPTPKRKRF